MPAKKRRRTRQAARPAGQARRPDGARPGRPPLEVGGGRRPELYDYQNPQSASYGYGGYRDNTVEFPAGRTRPAAERPQRPSRTRPGSGPQRVRPAQRRTAPPAGPQRREARRRRGLISEVQCPCPGAGCNIKHAIDFVDIRRDRKEVHVVKEVLHVEILRG